MEDSQIMKEVLREEKHLEVQINQLEKAIRNAPDGMLRTVNDRGEIRYYQRKNTKDTTGNYINKKHRQLASQLAQKEYHIKLLAIAQETYQLLRNFRRQYCEKKYEEAYEKMHPLRQALVAPYRLPDEEYVKQWQEQSYTGKSFTQDMPEIYTERGERVRSKSEKILADKFYLRGIPYRYECPLNLKGYGTVYPDFTLLNCRTRQEYYWEHFGLMDDAAYSEKAVRKIISYEKNGIFMGDRLLVTYETAKTALDMKIVEKLIDRYL